MGTHIGLFKYVPDPSSDFLMVLTPLDYTSTNNLQVDADFEVDWGDGVFTAYTAGSASSVASNSDSGLITVRSVNNPTHFELDSDTYTAADVQSMSSITSLNRSFYFLFNLTSIALDDTSSVTDFDYAFYYCWSLTSFPAIDTSAGTTFTYTWAGLLALTSFPVHDFSSTTSLIATWRACESLTSFPLITGTSNVTNWTHAFWQCKKITGAFPNIDISAGTNFSSTWKECELMTSIPSAFDFSNATTMNQAFRETGLTSFGSYDLSSCTDFDYMFYQCADLLTVGALDTTAPGSASTYDYMFAYSSSLATISAIDTTNTDGVSSGMFTDCAAMTSPDSATRTLLASASGYDFN